jgi:hypothetical protein
VEGGERVGGIDIGVMREEENCESSSMAIVADMRRTASGLDMKTYFEQSMELGQPVEFCPLVCPCSKGNIPNDEPSTERHSARGSVCEIGSTYNVRLRQRECLTAQR